jgi:predicted nucleotidyltransferase
VFRRNNIRKAILFGSFARAEASRRSDVDLILLHDTDKRFLDRYNGLLLELNQAIPGVSVEPLIYTAQEFDRMQDRTFIQRVLAEGKVIYELK